MVETVRGDEGGERRWGGDGVGWLGEARLRGGRGVARPRVVPDRQLGRGCTAAGRVVHGGRGSGPLPTAGRDGARWRRRGVVARAVVQVRRTTHIMFLGTRSPRVPNNAGKAASSKAHKWAAHTAQGRKTEKNCPIFYFCCSNFPIFCGYSVTN